MDTDRSGHLCSFCRCCDGACPLRRGRSPCRLDDGSAGVAFLFGAGIYCGSFLLLGTNFTYRLMFLLLCLPQLLDWFESHGNEHKGTRRLAYVLIGSCFISTWLKFHPEKTLHVNQITDWVLFAVLTMIMILNALYALTSLLERRNLRRPSMRANWSWAQSAGP